MLCIGIFAALTLFAHTDVIGRQSAAVHRKAVRKELVRRIDLRQKANEPLIPLVRVLLRAYCEGQLQGRYPTDYMPVSYGSFMYHFGIPQPTNGDAPTYETACGAAVCPELDPYALRCLSMYLDVIEQKVFDRVKSKEVFEVKYVRLMVAAECNYSGLEVFGVAFALQDMLRLSKELGVRDPNNTAVVYDTKQIFTTRIFSSLITELDGKVLEKPVKDEDFTQPGQLDTDY